MPKLLHLLLYTDTQTHTHASADNPALVDRQLDRQRGGGWDWWFKYKGIAQQGVAWGHQRISGVLTLLSHKSNATHCRRAPEQGTQLLTTVPLYDPVCASHFLCFYPVCVCVCVYVGLSLYIYVSLSIPKTYSPRGIRTVIPLQNKIFLSVCSSPCMKCAQKHVKINLCSNISSSKTQ